MIRPSRCDSAGNLAPDHGGPVAEVPGAHDLTATRAKAVTRCLFLQEAVCRHKVTARTKLGLETTFKTT